MATALGGNIRKRRIELGLEPAQVAKQIGRSTKTLYNIENGWNSTKPEVLHRLAKVLDLPIDQVMASDWVKQPA
ncbi:helix-turn-helix domain-containing protein [Amycolatopsis sp. NPDC059657]|uniref:helix-turn-helix domain-containing protein n=1 Tax=Amycolatopsis sp. NPDC059657 TaxID=3346899 RepID=UPI00366B4299